MQTTMQERQSTKARAIELAERVVAGLRALGDVDRFYVEALESLLFDIGADALGIEGSEAAVLCEMERELAGTWVP